MSLATPPHSTLPRTWVRVPLRAFFIVTIARASHKTCLPGSPGIETKRVGQRTAGTVTPQRPRLSEGGLLGGYKDYPALGSWSIFYLCDVRVGQYVTPSHTGIAKHHSSPTTAACAYTCDRRQWHQLLENVAQPTPELRHRSRV